MQGRAECLLAPQLFAGTATLSAQSCWATVRSRRWWWVGLNFAPKDLSQIAPRKNFQIYQPTILRLLPPKPRCQWAEECWEARSSYNRIQATRLSCGRPSRLWRWPFWKRPSAATLEWRVHCFDWVLSAASPNWGTSRKIPCTRCTGRRVRTLAELAKCCPCENHRAFWLLLTVQRRSQTRRPGQP